MTHSCWPCEQGAVAVEGEAHLWRPGKRATTTTTPAFASASEPAKQASEGEVSLQDVTSDAIFHSIDLVVCCTQAHTCLKAHFRVYKFKVLKSHQTQLPSTGAMSSVYTYANAHDANCCAHNVVTLHKA